MAFYDRFIPGKKASKRIADSGNKLAISKPVLADMPRRRISTPQTYTPYNEYTSPVDKFFHNLACKKKHWYLPIIPYIRELVKSNQDLSQALHTVVSLANTGHKIQFDSKVPQAQVDKMRAHLSEKQKIWGSRDSGMNSKVNKLMAQILITGAASAEWVPDPTLSTIENMVLVNPETIEVEYDSRNTTWEFFQKAAASKTDPLSKPVKIKLNPNTYTYIGLNGDEDDPRGFPPYLAALRGIKSQENMLDNIDFVVEQLGVMGFTELYITKPDQEDGEGDDQYQSRLENELTRAKTRIQGGLKEGTIVAYKDDHEVDFKPISKDFEGVTKIFEQNELMIASGAKIDATLLGRGYSTSETQITIVFTKLISELANLQKISKAVLEFGYELELRLQGFDFDTLSVVFNRSTLQDELKYQQGQEIRIRNLRTLTMDGLISQEKYAEEMGLEKPFRKTPLVPYDVSRDPNPGATQKKERKRDKQKSDKATRSKSKPQGTIRKQNN